ncbi:MAG: FliI/YscN family ATPase [Rickettsia sp.]|nr:FliI/YscN family ATPase [Rickettsia sp.]
MLKLELTNEFKKIKSKIENLEIFSIWGKILSIKSSRIEACGIQNYLSIGSKCELIDQTNNIIILLEVVGFEKEKIILMPLENIDGISLNSSKIRVNKKLNNNGNYIYPDKTWLGKVIDGLGETLDGTDLVKGDKAYKIKATPPSSMKRQKLGKKLETGIKAVDCFVSCCIGQKLGIIARSGTGKSVLISMIAKYSTTDVKIIGLIGERSKEIKEFIENYLDEDGMKNTIIIVATSDQSALTKINATYLTITIAEYFRDQGNEVLCIIDSMTRLAMAQREVGLMLGEYPTLGGYTPSVLNIIPKIIERTGPGEDKASITAFFTVLEEEENDIIGEVLKSFLDGHIILDRSIAQRQRFPAINVMESVSRSIPQCNSEEENYLLNLAKNFISKYLEVEELLNLGIYKKNSNLELDKAITYYHRIEKFLNQKIDQKFSTQESFKKLSEILDIK